MPRHWATGVKLSAAPQGMHLLLSILVERVGQLQLYATVTHHIQKNRQCPPQLMSLSDLHMLWPLRQLVSYWPAV
jgi:hypothetical protein